MTAETWDEARLLRMVNEKLRESASLEYKRSAALENTPRPKAELSKDVSAFANSGGGTLVYGIAENDREPERLDEGVDPAVISKEWLDDVISSTIHRKIDGVRIRVVNLSGDRAGRVAYVIEVPQSMRAPHMASDNKYYKRHNFKSEPMEDYEVRDVSLRAAAPILSVAFTFQGIVERPRVLPLRVLLCNDGREPASAAQVELAFDARVLVRGPGTERPGSISMKGDGSRWLPVQSHVFRWGGPASFPVFEGAPAHVVDLALEPFDFAGDGPFAIWWQVATPRALETSGAGVFRWDKDGMNLDTVTEAELFATAEFQWCPDIKAAWTLLGKVGTARAAAQSAPK